MRILSSMIAVAMLGIPAAMAAPVLLEEDRAAIVKDVIEHFRNNPGELVDAIVEWRERESRRAAAKVPVSGNLAGDVTIFEFPDYGCAPCRELSKAVDELAAADGRIRVVHHDYPLSGPDAAAAAVDLVAANAAGKDWKRLRAAYLASGVAPETRIAALDGAAASTSEAERDAALAVLVSNRQLAAKAGVAKLPAVIVAAGGKVQALVGTVTHADLQAAVERLRKAAAEADR